VLKTGVGVIPQFRDPPPPPKTRAVANADEVLKKLGSHQDKQRGGERSHVRS